MITTSLKDYTLIVKSSLVFVFITLVSITSQAQNFILFEEDFETFSTIWNYESISGENGWTAGTCAGNGISALGDSAAYITTGILDVCGEQYDYTPALSGTNSIVLFRRVSNSCGSLLTLDLDYKMDVGSNGSADVVYSLDNGVTWIPVAGGDLINNSGWQSFNLDLPVLLTGTSFDLGFRFTYDDSPIGTEPLAIDNIVLTAVDNEPPVINCELTHNVFTELNTCEYTFDEIWKDVVTFNDNCSDSVNITISQTPLNHTLIGHLDNIVVEVTATDEAGNSASCSSTIVLIDLQAPTTSCPSDFSENADASCGFELDDYTSLAIPSDNCTNSGDILISQSPLSGTTINGAQAHTITLTAEDAAGNTSNCTFNIILVDISNPSIICPNDTIIYANSSCEAVRPDYTSWSTVTVNDNCSSIGDLVITQNIAAGGTVLGLETIELTVTDEAGLFANCQFEVDLVDTLAPILTCPTAQTLTTNIDCEATVPDFQVEAAFVASDNCSDNANLTIQQIPAVGTLLTAAGLTTVEFQVTDEAGNTATCQFNLDVIDNISPTITCPSNQTLTADNNCQETIPDYTGLVTVDDNCSSPANITLTQSSPISILSGSSPSTTVTITAEDESGNTNSCQFDVTLIDNIAPEITCNGPLTFSANSDCEYVLGNVTTNTVATDNCTPQGSIIKSQSPIAGTILGIGAHTITITAEDENGNTDECSFQLTVQDNTDPNIIACAPNTSINADPEFCNGVLGDYRNLVNATDNCTASFDLSVSQSPAPSTVISEVTTVSLTVIDVSGNSSVCSFVVGLIDNTDPVLDCPSSVEATIVTNCDYTIPNLSSVVTATDNCSATGDLVFGQTPSAGSASSGTTNVTVTMTDQGGNTGSCIVQVIALDVTPPSITCPGDDVVNIGADCTTILSDFTSGAVATDNCFTISLSQSPAPGTEINSGNNEITITATDLGGNEASCNFNLLVLENIDPEITCPDDIETCDPIVIYTAPVGTDNCEAITEQSDLSGLTSGDTFPVGNTIQSYTVTDPSGNAVTCSFNVNVLNFPDQAVLTTSTIELCDTISTIISANQPTTGTGEWVVTQGSGTLNNQFANITGVNNLSIGENEIVWNVSTPQCGTNSATLTITVYELPLPASTVDTVYACDLQFVQLTSNQPSAGSGTWYDVNGNATFSDANNTPTAVFDLVEGWNQIVWSISNGSCPVSTDTANVYKTEMAVIQFPDEDTTILCLEDNFMTVVGNQAEPNTQARWYFTEGSGLLSTPFNYECSVTQIQFGTNILVYELKKQQCPATRDTAIIIVNTCNEYGDFPNMITPNGDGQNDVWVLDNLNSIYPDCVVRVFNRWGNIVFESEGYLDNWDGTHNGERLPMGTYYYTIDLNDAEGSVLKGYVSIVY